MQSGSNTVGTWVMRLVMAPVLLLGLSAVIMGCRLLVIGTPDIIGASMAVLMGLGLTALALSYYYVSFVSAPRDSARLESTRRSNPGEPWLERADWAARRVRHSSKGTALFMWVWVAGWWGALAFIGTVNRDKILTALDESTWNWALLGVFVLAGSAGLWLALVTTWLWWRFGTSTLIIDSLPAWVGDRFRGTIECRLQPLPSKALTAELVCEEIRWVTTGSGKSKSTTAQTRRLGATEVSVAPSALMTVGSMTRVPLDIATADDLPGYERDTQGNGVRWLLHLSTVPGDQSFSCVFEVPVFTRPERSN